MTRIDNELALSIATELLDATRRVFHRSLGYRGMSVAPNGLELLSLGELCDLGEAAFGNHQKAVEALEALADSKLHHERVRREARSWARAARQRLEVTNA